MIVSVIGAGKMGLPLAAQLAANGARVRACDINEKLVAAINRGEDPFDEPGLKPLIQFGIAQGRLEATTNIRAAVAESEVVIIIVPALLTEEKEIDLSNLTAASETVAASLHAGMMICYETTLPVGGARRYMLPLLEKSGLKGGVDFDLVSSPERVKSRLVLKHLTKHPKIVGSLTAAGARRAEEFYRTYLGAPVVNVGSLEAAEMVKLAGMIYRDVNIALANELALYAEMAGVDLPALLPAINSDGEAYVLEPGIGVGGHCTPVYPYFLTQEAERQGTPVTLAERARGINEHQPARLLDRMAAAGFSPAGKRVLVLGLAFRPAVRETACSTAFALCRELACRGAEAFVHDPLYSPNEIAAYGLSPGGLDKPGELVILNTAHEEYLRLDFAALRRAGVQAVLDGRNAWPREAVEQAGLNYFGVGRPPARKAPASAAIPVAKPRLGFPEAEAAAKTIRSGWIAQGPEVATFEREFAEYTGAPFACAVSSCTAALHLALRAAGVGPGDEVITVSHSFIATANAVRYCGALPVFVDIEPETGNINPALIERVVSPRTKAILCVHQLGMPCNLPVIIEIGRRAGIPVVEDAACAIGSEILHDGKWERIGRPHGDVACFSFHPRKILTTGDGGMLTTRHTDWDRKFRLWRQHGMSIPDAVRHGSAKVLFEEYLELGYNYRMTDVQAAIGREQLKRLARLIPERRELAAAYAAHLGRIPGVGLPVEPPWARSNWQSYCIRLPEGCDQRAVMQALLDEGIATRRGVMCAHREPAYDPENWSCGEDHRLCGCLPHQCRRLAQSEALQDRGLILPLYAGMTVPDVERVAAALAAACRTCRA